MPLALLAASVILSAQGTPQQAEKEAAQAALLKKTIAENQYSIKAENGKLVGPGMDFLMKATDNAQFFALGEAHFNMEIPQIATMLFQGLQERHGFNYLAIESGTAVIDMLNEQPYRGDVVKTQDFAHRYPYGLTFDSDQEAQMIADVIRISKGKGHPAWGLDQEFGAVPVLDRLRLKAPNEAARQAIDSLRAKAIKFESERGEVHFMARESDEADFRRLRDTYAATPNSWEAYAIEQLAKSQEIYNYYRRGERGEPTYYLNNYVREENMKDLFVRGYREAQRRGDKLPKVLLKFGQYHLYRGQSPTLVLTLGNFLSELAKSNGMTSFHVYCALNKPSDQIADKKYDFIRPFLSASGQDEWSVVDLRPLRPLWYGGLVPSIDVEFRRLILGYDAVLVLGNSHSATFAKTRGTH